MEYNGKALADLTDPKDPDEGAAAGRRAARRASRMLRDDGTHLVRLLDLLAAPGRRPATRWRGATTPTPTASARR